MIQVQSIFSTKNCQGMEHLINIVLIKYLDLLRDLFRGCHPLLIHPAFFYEIPDLGHYGCGVYII